MNKKLKQIAASLLSVLMIVCFMPSMAFADDTATTETPTTYVVQNLNLELDYTGEVPDLMNLDALATIQVKATDASSAAELLTMKRGQDYSVEATGAGPGQVEAKFTTMGNYAKDKINNISITIKEAQATSKYAVTVEASKLAYDGNALTAAEVANVSTVIKDGVENMDFDQNGYFIDVPTNTGDAGEKVKVTFYADSAKKVKIHEEEITIAKRDLSTLFFDGTMAETLTYNGKAQEAKFSSISYSFTKDGPKAVLNAADYEIDSFKDNVNAGNEAKAVIKAKSTSKNFTGSGEVAFTIGQFDLSGKEAYVTAKGTDVVFNGEKQTPAVNVTVAFSNTYNAADVPASDYKVTYAEESTNVGKYSVTVEPATKDGNLKGSKSVEAYSITKASLKNVTATAKEGVPAATKLTVDNIKDYYTIKLGNYELVPGTDYTVGEPVGNYQKKGESVTVKLTAAGANFSDDYTISYTTAPKKLAEVYTSAINSVVYDGTPQRPTKLGTLTVKGGTQTLTEGEDYQVAEGFANNTNAGTATATIKGINEYAGTATVEFQIKPQTVDASKVTVTDIKAGTYYVGAEVNGGTVKVGNTTMKPEDYAITAKEFASDAAKLTKVHVEFKGNYEGNADITLNPPVASTIASLSNAVVTGEIPAGLANYDDKAIKNYITVTIDGTEVKSGAYNVSEIACATANKNLGDLDSEISFKLTSSPQLEGETDTIKIKVVQRDLSFLKADENVTVTGSFSYDGEEKKPEPAVSVAGTDAKALVKDTDYTLSWKDNTNAGTATVTLTGKGNYKGTTSATFKIEKKDLDPADFVVSGADTVEYTPSDVVDNASKLTLKAATGKKYAFDPSDYEITLVKDQKAIAVGQKVLYNIAIKKDSKNYVEEKFDNIGVSTVITRTATDAEIVAEKTVFDIDKDKYSAVADLGKVTVKVDGVEVPASNYTVSVEGVTNKVTSELSKTEEKPFVVVTFKGGDYAGKAKLALTIVAAKINIKDVNLVAPTGSAAVYNGTPEKDATPIVPAVKDGGKDKLVADNARKGYFTIEYKDANGTVMKSEPVNAGTYTATVKATPAYGSEEGNSVTYTIEKKNLSKTEMEAFVDGLDVSDVEYMGENTKAPIIGEMSSDEYDEAIEPSKDFEVVEWDKTWNGDDETGNAKVGTKADGNFIYNGTVDIEFDWTKGKLYGEPSDYFEFEPQTYTGKALEPTLKAKEGTDVSVAWATIEYYENNVNASAKSAKARVTIVVPENEKKYCGETTGWITFAIVPAEGLTVSVEDAAYTGSPVTPAVTVKDANGAVLKEGTDYSVAFENNTYVGEGTVTVTGKGNYAGTATATFKIKEDSAKVEDATKAATEAAKAASAVTEANGYSKEDAAAVKAAADALAAVQAKDNATVKELSDATKALTDAIAKADANKAADKAAKAAAGVTASAGYEAADVTAVKKAAAALAAAKAKSGATAAEIQAATKALNAAVATANTNAKKAPAKVKLNKKKTKSAKKGKVTVVWKKVKGAKGYQVKVGNKTYNVKGAKKVKKIFKAKKGKRIAVKVRAYKVFKGKKIYGKWSAAKKVKIKK